LEEIDGGRNKKFVTERGTDELKIYKKFNDYELACLKAVCMSNDDSEAICNSINEINQLIEKALESGQVLVSLVRQDPLLKFIREDGYFQKLVRESDRVINIVPFM
jgi:hypothetical protein